MLLIARNSLLSGVQKCCSVRAVSSLVPTVDVDDFQVKNEPVLTYLPGSKEREELEKSLQHYESNIHEIPIIIGGKEYKTEQVEHVSLPYDHSTKIAKYYYASRELLRKAITVSQEVRPEWERVPLKEKISLFMKAADLFANKYRSDLNATTMLGQAKTVIQAEIDAAAELVDFFRFNAFFAKELTKYQPISENPNVTKNSMRYRGLEGFVASISPFNFTAIGGNLGATPTLMGNVVLWKPSDTAILSNWTIFKILQEVGFPDGVINFVPADGPMFGDIVTRSKDLAAINFTGSVPTFQWLWKAVSQNIGVYRNFPRLIGECGGKNFHFIHPSADPESVVNATIRGAFEYQGQKCSATSRVYMPESLWPKIQDNLVSQCKQIKMGPVTDFSNFMSAVIDEPAFQRIRDYIDHARRGSDLHILTGGRCDKSVGYFIEPTLIQTWVPTDRIMQEEIFGPVVTVYVYKESEMEDIMDLATRTSPYALTGAVFAQDEDFLKKAFEKFKMCCGNFYVNDRSTGSVVGQQPFGGARLSGTNDKAGGPHYNLRFASPQAVKETFVPTTEWKYPYMG